jgi:cytochrome P450
MTLMMTAVALGLMPLLQWAPISRLLGPSEKDESGFGKMMATARRMIETRAGKPIEGKSDMFASFTRHGLSKGKIFTEAMLQILAGSDTTATAIRATMLYTIAHPRVYLKLQTEIDAVVASEAAPGIVADTCVKAMPYLQAVVREGLRIHPAAANAVPKRVPKDGDTVTVDGREYFLPGGTNVAHDVWGLTHSKALFGTDADVFRPERWLVEEKNECDNARLVAMRRTVDMIFGYGKYQCLGKSIAWLEITKVIFEVCYLS